MVFVTSFINPCLPKSDALPQGRVLRLSSPCSATLSLDCWLGAAAGRQLPASIMTLWTWILMITKLSCVRARCRQTYFVFSIIPVFDIIDGQIDTFKLAWRQSQTVLSGQFLTIDRYEAKWAHISHPSPWNASEPFLGISRLWRTTCVLPVLLAAAAAACDLLCCVWWWWQKKPSFSITDANESLWSFHNLGEDRKDE